MCYGPGGDKLPVVLVMACCHWWRVMIPCAVTGPQAPVLLFYAIDLWIYRKMVTNHFQVWWQNYWYYWFYRLLISEGVSPRDLTYWYIEKWWLTISKYDDKITDTSLYHIDTDSTPMRLLTRGRDTVWKIFLWYFFKYMNDSMLIFGL